MFGRCFHVSFWQNPHFPAGWANQSIAASIGRYLQPQQSYQQISFVSICAVIILGEAEFDYSSQMTRDEASWSIQLLIRNIDGSGAGSYRFIWKLETMEELKPTIWSIPLKMTFAKSNKKKVLFSSCFFLLPTFPRFPDQQFFLY